MLSRNGTSFSRNYENSLINLAGKLLSKVFVLEMSYKSTSPCLMTGCKYSSWVLVKIVKSVNCSRSLCKILSDTVAAP